MRINLNTRMGPVAQMQESWLFIHRDQRGLSESVGLERSDALEKLLRDQPDTRIETVQHARQLIGNPAFPSRETIQQLAQLLAIQS